MRLYPDVYGRRFAWMLADVLFVGWIYLSVRAGIWVNLLILQLDALAQGVIKAGRTFDSWILSFEQGIPNGVPYLSDFLHRTAEALKTHSGDSLISAGQAGSRAIHLLALIIAIVVASIPILFALTIYLPRRLRLIADMRGVHVTLQRALAHPELTPMMLEILAGRAIYTLPYNQLLAYSRNPAEDWYLRRFEPLARAELERHGLSVDRYFGGRPALEA
ncbi:MAG TPA: hypothetical protein VHW91_05050 [Candidatus Dormibacteraeota bacterium]|jgi:hypothetical protein|nr:hypothetical protein [Candidatus Dormibacteraeota bacterium]